MIPHAVRPIAVAGMLALAGCGGAPEAPPAPPPPLVSTIVVRSESVPNIVELPGRIEAVRTAEVRARTDGIVEARLFQEGTDVPAGAPLFRIDQRDYRAQAEQARAALQRAEAARANAAAVVSRYRPLVSERAVSAQEYDAAVAELRTAEANVADARAAVSRAQLQLGFTIIRAPIAGRVGRAEVTEGALVSAASGTLMTRIDQLSPVYAVFTQSSSEIQTLLADARAGRIQLPGLSGFSVRLTLENGQEYGPGGQLDFADQAVDPTTGSQTIRARFPNPERTLLPGQFVRGHIQAGVIANGMTVPQRAVQFAGQQASVSVVGRDGSVAARPVKLGAQVNGRWIVQSGLRVGEQVIVEGWQKVQPGQKVRAQAAGGMRRTGATPGNSPTPGTAATKAGGAEPAPAPSAAAPAPAQGR